MTKINKSVKIYQRALAMTCMSLRYDYEHLFHAQGGFTENNVLEVQDFFDNIKNHEILLTRLTNAERYFLLSPIGSWAEDIMVPLSWHIEGVGTLLWTLGEIRDIPSLSESFTEREINKYYRGDVLNTAWIRKCLERQKFPLRDPEEVRQEIYKTKALWLRCLISKDMREGTRRMSRQSYDERLSLRQAGLPISASGDVIIGGREFCDLSEEEEGSLYPRALVRLQSFMWILDTSVSWDEIILPKVEEDEALILDK